MQNKKLLAYQINGNEIIGIDTNTWYDSDLNGNEPFIIINSGDTIPSGYTDITSIENLDKFGLNIANDYLVIKFEIRDIANTIGWSGLTDSEKDLAIKYYINPDMSSAINYLMTTKGMTLDEAKGFLTQKWHIHHGNLLNACRERWFYVKIVAVKYLSFGDAEDLFDTAQQLIYEYTEMGRLGINYGDTNNGIMDYLLSTNGYDGQGLEEENYTLQNGTWDDFKNELKNVLIRGIYSKYK
jgi:hypothetical protein